MSKVDRLKSVWYNMIQRCYNKNCESYSYYGARGISICDEWHDYETFRAWALDSGYDYDAPYGACTIDRIDVDGNYSPNNCRWVDVATQNRNRRPYTTSSVHCKRIPPQHTDGMTHDEIVSNMLYSWMLDSKTTLIDAANKIGISPNTLAKKIQCISSWYYNEVVAISGLTGIRLNELAGITNTPSK